jgi:hypothetical protein
MKKVETVRLWLKGEWLSDEDPEDDYSPEEIKQ